MQIIKDLKNKKETLKLINANEDLDKSQHPFSVFLKV